MIRGLAVSLALVLVMAVAGQARASTIVFQCGGGVCAIDPDVPGAQPRQLAPDGRVAGITGDGVTASWVDGAGALVQAPVAGGAATTVSTQAIGNQPSMAPDGRQYLWWQLGPGVFGGPDIYIYRYVVGADTTGVSHCVACTTSHGWLGASTPIAAFPHADRGPSQVCRIDAGPGSSCVQLLASDDRGGIGFPSGSPDGTKIAAALDTTSATGIKGHIVIYTLGSGTPTDVTTGTEDTHPAWSAEGTRLAFERAGQIVVRDLATGAERTVAQGTTPSWGGTATPPAKPSATLTASRSHRVSSWRTLRGRAANAPKSVQVAVTLRAGGHCRAWTGTRFSPASCSRIRYVTAHLKGSSWSLTLKGLKAGRLTVRVRAIGPQGATAAKAKSVTLR